MRLNSIFNSLMGLCVATAIVSCSDALVNDVDMLPVGGEASDMISFVVAENNTTRGGSFGNRPCGGAYLRSVDGADSLYLKAEVSDIIDDLSTRVTEIDNEGNKPSLLHMTCRIINGPKDFTYYFANTAFNKGFDSNVNKYVWSSTPPYYWLNNETHFNFYGYYAPKEAKGLTFKGNSDVDKNEDSYYVPTLEYTVPSDVKDHIDLSYSTSAKNEYIATDKVLVPVDLKHALSKIIFKTGDGMAPGTIQSITVKNVCDKGTLDLGTGDWVLEKAADGKITTNGEFTLSEISSVDGEITGSNSFMLLPGSNVAASEIEIKFQHAGMDKVETYVASLENMESWIKGKQYTYTITITPEYNIEIEIDSEYKRNEGEYKDKYVVDAHYIIAKAKVKVPVEKTDLDWNITVSAKNAKTGESYTNENVTVVSKANATYQQYYDQGYWLDKVSNNGIVSTESARGSGVESGNGEQELYIFIPENISDDDRIIEIKDTQTGVVYATITQRPPAWSTSDSNFGWEQIDDNESAQWGFYSKEKRVYVYNNSHTLLVIGQVGNLITKLIAQYDASQYVSYSRYSPSFGSYRYWVSIDYSTFANLGTNASNSNNGLQNTLDLNGFAGSAYSRSFEEALLGCTRVTDSSMVAFRRRASNDPSNVPAEVFDNEATTPMLPFVLKKNRYNINKSSFVVDDKEMTTLAPVISTSDIKWYLPAVEEFKMIPANVDTPLTPSECWSSTALNNSTDSYSGSSVSLPRSSEKKIRVCRKR